MVTLARRVFIWVVVCGLAWALLFGAVLPGLWSLMRRPATGRTIWLHDEGGKSLPAAGIVLRPFALDKGEREAVRLELTAETGEKWTWEGSVGGDDEQVLAEGSDPRPGVTAGRGEASTLHFEYRQAGAFHRPVPSDGRTGTALAAGDAPDADARNRAAAGRPAGAPLGPAGAAEPSDRPAPSEASW